MASNELQTRRHDAVRAWTSFVEHGDDAPRPWCAPRSSPAGPAPRPRSRSTSPRRRWTTSPTPQALLARLAAADRGRAGRGRAAAHRRGRRPGRRRHRPRDPDPVDVRRPGDAPQGRDRQLRGRRPLGRPERRHQRARPRQPARHARRWSSAPSTTRRSCTTGSAGPRRSTTPSPAQQLGVIDLSTTWDRTHPIGLATARVMARLIETAMPRSSQHRPASRRSTSRPSPGWR